MATRTELIQKIAEKLGVSDIGNTLSSEDSAIIGEAYDEIYEELRTDHLVSWGSADSIPDEAVRPMVYIVAFDLIEEYGISGEHAAKIEGKYTNAMARLRKSMAENYTPSNVNPDYF